MRPYFAIDRSLDTVNGQGHPRIIMWFDRDARNGFVNDSEAHHTATKAEAEVLCREWYKLTLVDAMRTGVI